MSSAATTFLVIGVIVALFVWNRIPVAIVAIGTALALYATGLLPLHQALGGFGDPTVIFIASLFVVSEAIDASGVGTWAGQAMMARAGRSRSRLLVLMMLIVAALTALISVNGAVAALLPAAVVIAIRRESPSQLLLPLAFAAHAGSLLTLTGTPVNIIVSNAAVDAGVEPFGYFEFAFVGVPLLAGTMAIVVLFGRRLLPHRHSKVIPADFSAHARTLVRQYVIGGDETLFTAERGVAEIVIPPRSALIGTPVFPGMVSTSGDLVVLAIQRKGADVVKEIELAAGDTLLIRGRWDALEQRAGDPDVLVVDAPDRVRRQAAPLGAPAIKTIAVLIGMVVLLATNAVPAAVAGLLAACAIVLLRVLTIEQAFDGISWTTVILVGGMTPLSIAMYTSGAAEQLAERLVQLAGGAGPYALLLGLFVLTAALGQLISNMATALIVMPIAVSAAAEIGISPRPVLMSVAVAAAAAFLTPVATPVNLMVMGPGGYRFGDYWKLGLPLLLLFLAVAVLLVPIVWPF